MPTRRFTTRLDADTREADRLRRAHHDATVVAFRGHWVRVLQVVPEPGARCTFVLTIDDGSKPNAGPAVPPTSDPTPLH